MKFFLFFLFLTLSRCNASLTSMMMANKCPDDNVKLEKDMG